MEEIDIPFHYFKLYIKTRFSVGESKLVPADYIVKVFNTRESKIILAVEGTNKLETVKKALNKAGIKLPNNPITQNFWENFI